MTPTQIRNETGLTQGQYKEAMRQREVKQYFKEHFTATGSGKNAGYTKLQRVDAGIEAKIGPASGFADILCPEKQYA